MHDLAPRIAAILSKYALNPALRIEARARLSELAIDRLDLPMIVLDIEDDLDVHIALDDEIESAATVADLIELVGDRMAASAADLSRRAAAPRIKRTWLSTDATHVA